MINEVARVLRQLVVDLADEDTKATEKACHEVMCILEDQMEEGCPQESSSS
jgi:hypothetical protein